MPFCGAIAALTVAFSWVETTDPRVIPLPLTYVEADRVANKLKTLFHEDADVMILSDQISNTVFIRAPADKIQQARRVLQQLDVQGQLMVFQLKNTKAGQIARIIKDLLRDNSTIMITADENTNSIIVYASPRNTKRVRTLVQQLDNNLKATDSGDNQD